jgi:hypothetical protein
MPERRRKSMLTTNDHGAEHADEKHARRAEHAAARAVECFCERYLAIPRDKRGEDHAEEESHERRPRPAAAAVAVTYPERSFAAGARWLFWASLAALALWVALHFAVPEAALAQQGDGGRIQGTIDNARNWLSGLMVSLGGLGMIASIAVKAVARTNENMHHAAHMGMTGSGIALIAGLLINDIISLLQSFVGG